MPSFVDKASFTARAGSGGNGCVSFHREKFVMNGGPDGGDGGVGGNIVLRADENMNTLLDFRYKAKYEAENGEDGRANRCNGRGGADLVISVPVGTVVKTEDGRVVADMFAAGETHILLHGGRGGWGNAHFATPVRQAPNFAKPGVQTQTYRFTLELLTIADVGLVGFPNVGKSTLLSAVTRAQPRIANYHFTTLTPNLGFVRRHGSDYIIADIPGLVEGAAQGAGLGQDFLRHVERTRLLVHVVDMAGSEGRDPLEDYRAINHELEQYGDLIHRPQIVAANKMDLPDADVWLEEFRAQFPEAEIIPISAFAHKGLDELLDCIEEKLRELPPLERLREEELMDDMPDLTGFTVEKQGKVYVVSGSAVDHLIASVNFEDTESVKWFHRSLRRSGIIDALRHAGAGEGDTVELSGMQFDFIE